MCDRRPLDLGRFLQSHTLGEVCIDVYEGGINTVMDGGTVQVPGGPHDTDEYRAMAQDLGYGADTLGMCRDHEAAHTLMAFLMGLPHSQTLYRVGTGQPDPDGEHEEALVLAFQRWCRMRGVSILYDLLPRYMEGH